MTRPRIDRVSADKSLPPPPRPKVPCVAGKPCPKTPEKQKFTDNDSACALLEAKISRGLRHSTRRLEVRRYECHEALGGCGYWHLTSREAR